MLIRQKLLLRLLSDCGGSCSKLQLMKLAFLLAREGRSEQLKTFMSFVPYKYGPYSFGLTHELNSLVRDELVSISDKDVIELIPKGKKLSRLALEPRLSRDVELVNQNYRALEQKS